MAVSVPASKAYGSAPFLLQVSAIETLTARFSAPASRPARRHFAVQGDGTDCAFDRIAVSSCATFSQQEVPAITVFGETGQGLTGRSGKIAGVVMAQPCMRTGQDPDGAILARGEADGDRCRKSRN